MNVDDLFELFSGEDKEISKDKPPALDFTQHPVYWVGMFTKIIKNHNGFTEYAKKLINQIDPKRVIELEKAEELGDWVTFNRAWFYIEKLNLKDEFHYESLIMAATQDTITALDITLLHFEQLEEYEKCTHLFNIKNELKEYLK